MRERVWPALGVLLIAPGAAGAFGSGALEQHQASGIDLVVSYVEEAHLNEAVHWSADVLAPLSAVGTYSLRLSDQELARFAVASVEPAPLSVRDDGYDTVYTFSALARHVDFSLMPRGVGKTAATIQFGLDPPVPFSVTTLP